jgi:acetyl-CoA C-acetyltransferase
MPVDPRAPVLVGLGERTWRPAGGPAPEPAAMAAEAVREALADAGAGDALLRRVRAVAGIPSAGWPDGDPAGRTAELLGLAGVHTLRTSLQGGNGPQLAVSVLADRIQAGALDAAVVCGAEALATVAAAMRAGEPTGWPEADGARAAGEVLEGEAAPATDEELAVGLIAPIMAYPLIENALRAAAGRTLAAQQALIAGLWSRFSAVAATRPELAWSPRARTAEEIGTPSPSNRLVSLPYTKLLNANIQVDQAAALVLCSAQTARSAGVPRERWVFVHAGAQAADEWFLSHRATLAASPAIAACGRAVLGHAGIGADELGPVDLYSCFPAAVQLAADALGLPLEDPGRPLTCTGGLTFFGGPGNDYATHGIAAVARELRAAPPGTHGLATALGWYATKHAVGLYGNAEPARPFRAADAAPDAPAARPVAAPGDHDAVAETGTVIYERDGSPSYGILFALLPDGRRVLGMTRERAVLEAMATDGFLGSTVRLRPDRRFSAA